MNLSKIGKTFTSTIMDQMVEIPSGNIELRDDRIKSSWVVDINSFMLAKFLVTQELYFDVVKEQLSTIKGTGHPVETVTWKEAVIFCNKFSNQLGLNRCYNIQEE